MDLGSPDWPPGRGWDTTVGMDLPRLAAVTLRSSDGEAVRLGSLWAERPVVLVFLRHFG
jgi:hypothetical protein